MYVKYVVFAIQLNGHMKKIQLGRSQGSGTRKKVILLQIFEVIKGKNVKDIWEKQPRRENRCNGPELATVHRFI